MKKIYLSALILITSIITNAQEGPKTSEINPVAKGMLTEATGWTEYNGKMVSRKNRVPADVNPKILDFEEYALGENHENFTSFELREMTIDGKSFTILIKKYKEGMYRYEEIKKGWSNDNSLRYYVFETSELEKLKNLEPEKVHSILIPAFASGEMYSINEKLTLNNVAKNAIKYGIYGRDKLLITIKLHEDKTRFLIESKRDFSTNLDFEKSYYETPTINFEKLFALK